MECKGWQVSFLCVVCGELIGDDSYTRHGHCPANVCYSCWCDIYELEMKPKQLNGGSWGKTDIALQMTSQGYSYDDIADTLKVDNKTLYNWRQRIRANPELLPLWVSERLKEERDTKQVKTRISVWRANNG